MAQRAFICGLREPTLGEDERAFFYEIDPLQYEEVTLWRVPPSKFLTVRSLDRREVVCRFWAETGTRVS